MNNVRGYLYYLVAAKYRELDFKEVQQNPVVFIPHVTTIIKTVT